MVIILIIVTIVFIQKMVTSVGALITGDPEDDETFCGAVNSKQHYQKVVIIVFVVAAVYPLRLLVWNC